MRKFLLNTGISFTFEVNADVWNLLLIDQVT
jgi:hypothetical protein